MSDNMPSIHIMQALLQNPQKKALILQFLAKHGQVGSSDSSSADSLSGTGLPSKNKINTTPPHAASLKKKRKLCESPSALYLRKVRENHERQESTDTASETSSERDEVTKNTPKVPFDQLLKGVVAFVEVKNNGVDKSDAIKALMSCMGAVVKDKFTGDITHVVFKDGSHTTFDKAKLVKAHLVSMLWLKDVRKYNCRVPEKNYPAFTYEKPNEQELNVTVLCSELEKEYKELVKDEKRRSLEVSQRSSKAPLQDKNRRRTIITPASSSTSYHTTRSTSTETVTGSADAEVQDILKTPKPTSPILTSDDSDCGIVNGESSKSKRKLRFTDLLQTSPALTDDFSVSSTSPRRSTRTRSDLSSTVSESLLTNVRSPNSRRTDNVLKNMVLTPPAATAPIALARNLFQEDSQSKTEQKNVDSSSVTMSSLRISSESSKTVSGLLGSFSSTKTRKSAGVLSNRCDSSPISTQTNMSSLRVSTVSISNSEATKNEENNAESNNQNAECTGEMVSRPQENEKNSSKIVYSLPENSVSRSSSAGSIISSNTTPTVIAKRSKKTASASSVARSQLPEANLTPNQRAGTSKKTRKLYSPSDIPLSLLFDDDKERRDRLREKNKHKKTQAVFVHPGDVLIKSKDKKKKSSKQEPISQNDKEDLLALLSQNVSTDMDEASEDAENLKKTKNKQKKAKKSVRANGDHDEQKELVVWLENVNQPEKDVRRRSQRLSISQLKEKYTSSDSEEGLPLSTPSKRRSTMYFENITSSQKKLRRERMADLASIVGTKMHRHEDAKMRQIVSKLGRFFVENEVSQKTTHLVAAEAKRTINFLRALARGCWILKHEWLLDSMTEGKWLPEEEYEITGFSDAVQQCRLQRQAFGPHFTIDIFQSCGYIYITKKTVPEAKILKELVALGKGKLTMHCDNAKVIVGEFLDVQDSVCVTVEWILDSITYNKLKSFKKYQISPRNSPCY